MSDILLVNKKVLIAVEDISSVRGYVYTGEADEDLTGKYYVRVFSKTPFINLVCDSLEEAQILYREIMSSRKVVSLDEMRID